MLSACGARDEAVATLVSDPTTHRVCLATTAHQRHTAGLDVLWVRGSGHVTIRDVRLSEPTASPIDEVDLIQLQKSDDFGSFGLWDGYPPGLGKDAGIRAAWSRRVPAVGATLRPGPHRFYNLVFGLQAAGGPTQAEGSLVVDYVDGSGHAGRWISPISYQLARRCGS